MMLVMKSSYTTILKGSYHGKGTLPSWRLFKTVGNIMLPSKIPCFSSFLRKTNPKMHCKDFNKNVINLMEINKLMINNELYNY